MKNEAAAEAEARLFFSQELLQWYRTYKRQLPWRSNRDPYRIWVSEIMLQQTRVDTVIPYYERFMAKFPTIAALAEAPEEEVLKCWEGLGYYSRARNLQAGAREVMLRHGGAVPEDADSVAALKGVGPYTKGAIMSIAFNAPQPAVDGNVMRVLSRYFCLEHDIAKNSTRVGIESLAVSLIPEGAARDFNQALMELGALVCTPRTPGCLTCPVMEHCAGRLAGRELELPIKTKAKRPRPEQRMAALIRCAGGEHAGKILVRQRPDTGLLAQMWELPHVLVPGGGTDPAGPGMAQPAPQGRRGRSRKAAAAAAELAAAAAQPGPEAAAQPPLAAGGPAAGEQAERMALLCRSLAQETRLLVRPRRWWMVAEHVFSHIHWTMHVCLADFGFVLREHELAAEGIAAASQLRYVAEAAAAYAAEAETANAANAQGVVESVAASATYIDEQEALPQGYRWIGPEALRELAFPNVFLRILRAYWDEFEEEG